MLDYQFLMHSKILTIKYIIMKKQLILSALLVMLCVSAFSQKNDSIQKEREYQTLFGDNRAGGFYGAFNMGYSVIDDDQSIIFGGRFVWIVNHSVGFGFGGNGFINEYHYDNISSSFTDGGKYEYNNVPNRYEYGLETPFRFLAGIAFQIEKFALLSADYEYADYNSAHFYQTSDGYNYSEKNQNIKNSLKAVNNFRAGGEFRLKNIYFRTGYGYYGKAFKPGEDNEDLDYTTFSFGTGFRERSVSIDFGYTHNNYSQKYYLYPLNSSYDPALANLNTVQNMFTLTFGYRFGY